MPPMAMLQASDSPVKWGVIGIRRLRGRDQTEESSEERIVERWAKSLATAALMCTVAKGFQARLMRCLSCIVVDDEFTALIMYLCA